jgi:hypothetical protein
MFIAAQKQFALKSKEQNVKDGDKYIIMNKTINRKQFIAEELIREHIRDRIITKLSEDKLAENKLRQIIRLLLEAETGTEEPSQSTGINVLADLLQKIIPTIEDAYKMLTTSKEQRDSFRNHIIHAVENSLRPIGASDDASSASNTRESIVYEIDANILSEKVSIDLDPQVDGDEAESVEGEFIDIGSDDDKNMDFVEIEDQNETGRNFAATTFKNVEKQMVDAYDMLADLEDKNLFYDYLVTNLLLYFDKFEDDLQNTLPDVSTEEYEETKSENEETASPEEDLEEPSDEEDAAEEMGGGGPSGDE